MGTVESAWTAVRPTRLRAGISASKNLGKLALTSANATRISVEIESIWIPYFVGYASMYAPMEQGTAVSPMDGLLGHRFFAEYSVFIDFGTSEIYLRPRNEGGPNV